MGDRAVQRDVEPHVVGQPVARGRVDLAQQVAAVAQALDGGRPVAGDEAVPLGQGEVFHVVLHLAGHGVDRQLRARQQLERGAVDLLDAHLMQRTAVGEDHVGALVLLHVLLVGAQQGLGVAVRAHGLLDGAVFVGVPGGEGRDVVAGQLGDLVARAHRQFGDVLGEPGRLAGGEGQAQPRRAAVVGGEGLVLQVIHSLAFLQDALAIGIGGVGLEARQLHAEGEGRVRVRLGARAQELGDGEAAVLVLALLGVGERLSLDRVRDDRARLAGDRFAVAQVFGQRVVLIGALGDIVLRARGQARDPDGLAVRKRHPGPASGELHGMAGGGLAGGHHGVVGPVQRNVRVRHGDVEGELGVVPLGDIIGQFHRLADLEGAGLGDADRVGRHHAHLRTLGDGALGRRERGVIDGALRVGQFLLDGVFGVRLEVGPLLGLAVGEGEFLGHGGAVGGDVFNGEAERLARLVGVAGGVHHLLGQAEAALDGFLVFLLVLDSHALASLARHVFKLLVPLARVLADPLEGGQVLDAAELLFFGDVVGRGDGVAVLVLLRHVVHVEAVGPLAGIRVDDPAVEGAVVVPHHGHAAGGLGHVGDDLGGLLVGRLDLGLKLASEQRGVGLGLVGLRLQRDLIFGLVADLRGRVLVDDLQRALVGLGLGIHRVIRRGLRGRVAVRVRQALRLDHAGQADRPGRGEAAAAGGHQRRGGGFGGVGFGGVGFGRAGIVVRDVGLFGQVAGRGHAAVHAGVDLVAALFYITVSGSQSADQSVARIEHVRGVLDFIGGPAAAVHVDGRDVVAVVEQMLHIGSIARIEARKVDLRQCVAIIEDVTKICHMPRGKARHIDGFQGITLGEHVEDRRTIRRIEAPQTVDRFQFSALMEHLIHGGRAARIESGDIQRLELVAALEHHVKAGDVPGVEARQIHSFKRFALEEHLLHGRDVLGAEIIRQDQRLELVAVGEHVAGVGDRAIVEAGQVQRRQRLAVAEHVRHVIDAGGVKVADVDGLEALAVLEHVGHGRDVGGDKAG